jgi:hypothetical protein
MPIWSSYLPGIFCAVPDRSGNSPAPGAVQHDERANGVAGVAREANRGNRLDRSIRPGVPIPATLLVAQMGDGALFLQGWRDGPHAYVVPEGSGPLRQALAAAFGSGTSDGVPAGEVRP